MRVGRELEKRRPSRHWVNISVRQVIIKPIRCLGADRSDRRAHPYYNRHSAVSQDDIMAYVRKSPPVCHTAICGPHSMSESKKRGISRMSKLELGFALTQMPDLCSTVLAFPVGLAFGWARERVIHSLPATPEEKGKDDDISDGRWGGSSAFTALVVRTRRFPFGPLDAYIASVSFGNISKKATNFDLFGALFF